MDLAAYLRVSTATQADDGAGLDVQLQAIESWARKNHHRIVAVFREEGVSGSNGIETRQALPQALALLADGDASGVVVYRLDRLARDLVLQEQLLAEVRRLGAELFTTSDGEQGYLADDPDDPSRKLIRQVLGAVAEYERGMITLRLRSGRKHKAMTGGFAYGSPPYGYRSDDGVLVPQQEEQAAIARMLELRAGGSSLRFIAEALDAEGYPPKRGSRWHPTTVARVLQRLNPIPEHSVLSEPPEPSEQEVTK